MFIFWNNHTATASGSVSKYVRCEQCSAEYGYVLHRDVKGQGISPFFLDEAGAAQRASDRADAKLKRALHQGVDPSPCPSCGQLQEDMVQEARKRHLRWMSFPAAILALVISPAVFILSLLVMNAMSGQQFIIPLPIFYNIWIGFIVAIIVMPFIRLLLAALYDPRKLTPEQLSKKGYSPGTPLDHWDDIQSKVEDYFHSNGIGSLYRRSPKPEAPSGPEHP